MDLILELTTRRDAAAHDALTKRSGVSLYEAGVAAGRYQALTETLQLLQGIEADVIDGDKDL